MQEPNPSRTEREERLRPYLEELSLCQRQGQADGAAVSLPPWAEALALDPWEKNILERGSNGPSGQSFAWSSLVLEGTALRAKCRSELGRLKTDSPDEKQSDPDLHRELTTDAAVGLAIMEEIQRAINTMVLAGQIEQARKLTGFRGRVNQSLCRIKELIGKEALAQAEALSVHMLAPQAEPRTLSTARLEEVAEQSPPRPRQRPPQARTSARTERPVRNPVSTLLRNPVFWIITVVVAGSILAGWLVRQEPPLPELKRADFRSIPEISKVMVQSPHVYLTVDSVRWGALSPDQRRQLVDIVAETARASGYTGAHFLTSDGRLAAQWRAETGTRLF